MLKGEIATIGKYRILGQIGEGAMGVVYRAHDPVLNRLVAIKVMSDALARDTELRDRFLREAQAAGSLQHPNVVTIYDFGEVDGHPFIAMEFVEGADLSEILLNKSPLTLIEKVDVLIDVLNGLSYAHKHGIVHRDVKPANIRIDEDGRARIMDFGIAHLNSSSMTRTGAMVGTPAYMSPEQITGGPIAASCDIFAMGAVMYELLTGVQAFRGDSLQSVMYKIVSAPTPEIAMDPATLIAAAEASVAKALGGIVERALAKEPSGRYPTAMDMVAALGDARARIVDGRGTPRSSASLRASVAKVMADAPESKVRRAKRRRTMGAGIGVAFAAVVSVMWVTRGRTVSAPPPPARTNPTASTPVVQSPTVPASVPAATGTTSAPTSAPSSTLAPDSAKSRPTAPSVKELGLFRALQSTALDARHRAMDAGASAAQLEGGDAQNRTASALVLQGKTTEAADRLHQATTMWGAAERAARQAATAAAPAKTDPVEAPKVLAAPAVGALTAPQPQAPQPAAPQPAVNPAAATPPPPNPSIGIAAAVATYARALESRDLTAVRRAYPGITTDQAKGWEQFFATLRSIRVNFSIDGLVVNGTTADARLIGTYDFVTEAGKSTQQPVSFQASFRRDGVVWQLVAVH